MKLRLINDESLDVYFWSFFKFHILSYLVFNAIVFSLVIIVLGVTGNL